MHVKIFSVLVIPIAISGCFSSNSVKKQAVIVDKSTYQYATEKTPLIVTNNTKTTGKTTEKTTTNEPLPVAAKVLKTFSKQHTGITFDTLPDQAIRAIQDGTIVYSDVMKNHGQMIVIKHKLGFYSTYTQGVNLRVSQNEQVKKGQIIAFTGKQAFYFSMKKFKTPIDPLKYLMR